MAARPCWQGHLKLSLVTCPVALYNAVSASGDVHFNLINPKTGNRIKMITTDPDTGPIERSELVKGYQVEKGRYILLTNEEIAAVKLESTKSINIERFVDATRSTPVRANLSNLSPTATLGPSLRRPTRCHAGQQDRAGSVVMSTRERLWRWSRAARASS